MEELQGLEGIERIAVVEGAEAFGIVTGAGVDEGEERSIPRAACVTHLCVPTRPAYHPPVYHRACVHDTYQFAGRVQTYDFLL